MKSLRQLCAAITLTLVLTLSAFAGDMGTPFAPPQPPPTAQGEMDTPYVGEISTTSSIPATDSVTGIALALVQSVLALV